MPSNESSTTPETAPKSDEVSARARLAAMLAEHSPPPETGTDAEAGESHSNAEAEGEPKGKPKVLKDLAQRLKLEDKDLYDVEVPMPNGKAVKIGALKDAHAKQEDFTVRELAFEDRVSKQEAEWTRHETELAELLSAVDQKAITPELKERVRQKVDAANRRERDLVLKTIPEWTEPTVREAELALMVEDLKDFGIPESFLTANINHKLFRYVRRNALREQKWRAAVEAVVQVKKPSTTGKSTAGNGAARRPDVKPPQSGRVTARDRLEQALAKR